jgi:hypothetical protein
MPELAVRRSFEELRNELVEAFPRDLERVAPFPQPGMFQSREDATLVESQRRYADEFIRLCANTEVLCE